MWLRKVQIIVTQKDDPSKQTIFEKHRIDFEVRSLVGWPADTATITLFNLSLDEVKFLQSKNYGDTYIEIRAGYQDQVHTSVKQVELSAGQTASIEVNGAANYPTLFSGLITNAVGFRRPPEHVTQLFCISKAYGIATDFKAMRPIPPKTALTDAIKSMCNDYGFNTITVYGVDDSVLATQLPRGRTFQDTFLIEFKKLLGEYNLLYTMTTSEIQIFPDTYGDLDAVDRMSKRRAPIKLDPNSVIGNPLAGIRTYNLSTFLNPAIQPGMIMDVSPLVQTSHRNKDNSMSYDDDGSIFVNGVTSIQGGNIALNTDQSIFRWAMEDKYFITTVIHHGSTHGLDFQTSLTGILGGNSMMGDKESSWQEMYANSGMASEIF